MDAQLFLNLPDKDGGECGNNHKCYEKSMNNVIIIIRVFTYIFTAKGEYIYDRFKLRINGAKNES